MAVALKSCVRNFGHNCTSVALNVKYKSIDAAQICSQRMRNLINKICDLVRAFFLGIVDLHTKACEFITGSSNRLTIGDEFTAAFPMPPEDHPNRERLIELMEKFTDYALTSQGYYDERPLSEAQLTKLREMIEAGDPDAQHMGALLNRCDNPKFHRSKFDGHDLVCLDKISFELVKEFTGELAEFFNTGHFDGIADDIEGQFGMQYYEAVIAEVLSRSIAYNSQVDGKTISLPVLQEDGTYGVAEFTINCYHLGDSLPAYILECKNEAGEDIHTPWFVVRGTETSMAKTTGGHKVKRAGFESLLADSIHPDGVGEGIVDKWLHRGRDITVDGQVKHQPSLTELVEGRQIKLSGHSLGGALVNLLATHLYDNVESAYAFNAPGVSAKAGRAWDRKANPSEHKLFNIQPQGDRIPAAGEKLIGTHLAFTHLIKPEKADFVHIHVLMCLTKPFKLQLVDKESEEAQSSRKTAEVIRRTIGMIVRKTMRKLKYDLPDWYQNRHIFAVNPFTNAHAV